MHDQAEKLRLAVGSMKDQIEQDVFAGMKHTRVIAVTSGKGGVGKTNIALNLSLALAANGVRVILMDADMGLANIDIIIGVVPKYNLYHVIRGEKTVKEIMLIGPHNLSIIPGGSGIRELANLPQETLKRVINDLGRFDGEYDLMIIDTGAGISQSVLSFLTAADDVIVITTPEPTSLTDAYGIIKAMSAQRARGTIYIVINRVEMEAEGVLVAHKLTRVAENFLGVEVEPMGYLVEDEVVEKAVKEQQPFIINYPNSAVSKNIRTIAEQIHTGVLANQTVTKPSGLKTFFRNLTNFFR
ncbi:MAG: MinD/ParA family protein [Syntrophothermaceae bacterium]|jgi:flagellar biosynthesis protein FlhG